MVLAYWTVLVDLAAEADALSSEKEIDHANASLAAVAETISDILPTANVGVLREGLSVATAALSRVKAMGANDQSPDFIAGRLSAIVDILGYAAAATADDVVVETAKQEKHKAVLRLLASASFRDVDLAEKLGEDIEAVSASLNELHSIGLVTTHRHGTERYHNLTPVGKILSDDVIGRMEPEGRE
ncbi:hypothetical protein [Rhizobium sp. BK176]|uniref:hypothetical protein n=1 Tax=Rhizobium sp. BK176 TaxID=2587071 RepID=UPI002169724C|nr:hypothetical protein [Rhizobium sp. BK176]MCS4088584.1 putative Rossmann fold nucleotide-binding protein DprA/Smf involved in DNA uptake [Rhizobium sp. BK176]